MTCNRNIPAKDITGKPLEFVVAVSRTHCTRDLQTRRKKHNKWCLRDRSDVQYQRSAHAHSYPPVPPTRDVHIRDWIEVQLRFVRTSYLLLCCMWLERGINTAFGLFHAGWPVESDAVTETCCYGPHISCYSRLARRHQTHAVKVKAVPVSRGQYIAMSFVSVWSVCILKLQKQTK